MVGLDRRDGTGNRHRETDETVCRPVVGVLLWSFVFFFLGGGRYLRPLGQMLFPELVGAEDAVEHYGFVVRYKVPCL